MSENIRGLEESAEINVHSLRRDTRPILTKFFSAIPGKDAFTITTVSCIMGMFFFPAATHLFLLIGLLHYTFRYYANRKSHLPFRMPMEHEGTDWNTRKPGGGYDDSEGIFMFGNTFGVKEELWGRAKDILTHILTFGTTGSGKTEFLVSMAFNSLAVGSGFFYVDPKAAPKLQSQIFMLCRFCGRDDDFRSINYLTRGKSDLPGGVSPIRTTNTTNPFTHGRAEALSDMMISLIPKSEGSNAIFNQNAQALMRAAMYAFVELRDAGEMQLSAATIRERLSLQEYTKLLDEPSLSENTKLSIKAFLTSIGWQEGRPLDKQPRSLPEQYGYARGYFGLALNNLTDTYGHIYRVSMGEVDMFDVVQNRRILVVLLPSLALSPEETKNLGIISLSSVKNAISVGLGDGREGVFNDILYSLPTDAPAPFLSITDEYAAIPTPGYIEVLTQGRGLGVAAIVASQDYAGISKADPEGAQQMLENSKFKFALKMESATDTWDMFNKMAGEVSVMESGGMNIEPNSTISTYNDNLSAQVRDRGRIHLRDLQEQIEGEFHAFFNGGIVRGFSFYANVPLPKTGQLRINQLVELTLPDKSVVDAQYGSVKALVDTLISKGDIEQEGEETPAASKSALPLLNAFGNPVGGRMETAIIAFMEWRRRQENEMEEFRQNLPIPPAIFNQGAEETPEKPVSGDPQASALKEAEASAQKQDAISESDDLDDPFGDLTIDEESKDETSKDEAQPSREEKQENRAKNTAALAESVSNTSQWMQEQIIDDNMESDLKKIGIAGGEEADEAEEFATEITGLIKKNLDYPQPPLPEKKGEDQQQEMSQALGNLLTNIRARNKKED